MLCCKMGQESPCFCCTAEAVVQQPGLKATPLKSHNAMLCSLVNALRPSILLQQYWFNTKTPYSFVSVVAFAHAFKQYKTGQRNAGALSVPYPADSAHKQALIYEKYALSSECRV